MTAITVNGRPLEAFLSGSADEEAQHDAGMRRFYEIVIREDVSQKLLGSARRSSLRSSKHKPGALKCAIFKKRPKFVVGKKKITRDGRRGKGQGPLGKTKVKIDPSPSAPWAK